MNDIYYMIGIDGGASNTRGVLFTNDGKTKATKVINPISDIVDSYFIAKCGIEGVL